jgi:hypothetical protein
MEGAILDQLDGKQYDLPVFENNLVRVESAGRVIRVGIKENGMAFSWWEPTHPFSGNRELPNQRGWTFRVVTRNENETTAIFSRDGTIHRLTLVCTDPSSKPKPIEVKWNTFTQSDWDKMRQELQEEFGDYDVRDDY